MNLSKNGNDHHGLVYIDSCLSKYLLKTKTSLKDKGITYKW